MAARDERLFAVLQKIAPGTSLREGVDRIIKAGKGAIIVLGYSDRVEEVISGGFKMATKFTAQRLSEVAKMDGAIVVDDAIENILYANVHLVPHPSIQTSETGSRHRSAERVARQTGKPVISVSESMRIVSVYVDAQKHVLEEISSVLFRANQALATLERYRGRLDEVSNALSGLEIENAVALRDVLSVLQRAEMVRRIAEEIEVYIAELGTDGRLLQLQLDELVAGVDSERALVVRDYQPDRRRKPETLLADIEATPPEGLLDFSQLAAALGYDPDHDSIDQPITPRGYRLLRRVPQLPDRTVERLVQRFSSLQRLMEASLEDLDEVEGIGATRARSIKEGLTRLAEYSMFERYA
ncbi:MAG TPA: DNA integrity scanning diadenylate cyclase DisA [Egibacteraceae bacterium]|nr:DNA integrity scanning diadenylate cyclase DisA [Actinomycetota bacterium]HWB71758.1 DNA integrity scanning diadenylate cyclase DisA [Egibacteraceae bacterium]